MEYDTKNIEVRARMDDVAHAIKAMPAVSRLSQTHNGHMFSRKPTGFNATLKCYMSKQHGGCGKAQEATVLLTHSRTALLACLDELRREKNGIFFFWKKRPFPSGAPLSGLGAKCLSAVELDNQDRALHPQQIHCVVQVAVILIFRYSAAIANWDSEEVDRKKVDACLQESMESQCQLAT